MDQENIATSTDSEQATITELLRAAGAATLGDDPSPEARRAVLESARSLLNGSDPLTRAQVRTELVRTYKLPAKEADAVLGGHPEASGDTLQGQTLALSDPEPWPESVDGAELLDDLAGTFRRYLGLPTGGQDADALWTVHAHAHDAAEVSPLLAFTSPTYGCGKTTALEVLSALVPRPLPASSITPAVVFRAVEKFSPTLLIDEADTIFGDRSNELRGILNSGHLRAGAFVLRSVGDDHEPHIFRTWAPKAIALIGRLPATLADRSIEIRMRRRAPGEKLERFRRDRPKELEPLRRRCWRWAQDNSDALRTSDPNVPPQLHDRAADNARPLLAIADLVGGEWPARARTALLALYGARDEDDGEAGVLLLGDLRELFEKRGADRLASAEIVAELLKMEERPWPEWRRGQPLSARGVARLLHPFGIRPKKLRAEEKLFRGYERTAFIDAWDRYLCSLAGVSDPEHPEQCRNHAENPASAIRNKRGDVPDSESAENPRQIRDVPDVPHRTQGSGGDTHRIAVEHDVQSPDDDSYEMFERAAIQAEGRAP